MLYCTNPCCYDNRSPIPVDEAERLADLRRHQILDTPEEDEFNDLILLASRICSAPISLISLIDSNRQWLKARNGIDAIETDRDASFCSHTILENDVFIIPDATLDERFWRPYAGQPGDPFYAGVPLVSQAGYKLGSLCVIDAFRAIWHPISRMPCVYWENR